MSRALNSVFMYNMMIYPYFCRESSDYDEIRYADANFDPRDVNVRKFQKIPKLKVADGRQIENHFVGYNSAPYCPTKMKFGMRRYNRTLTKVR